MSKGQKEVSIGFKYGLNYPFVVSQPLAAAQIFNFLPQGLGYGLDKDADQFEMIDLSPYNKEGTNYLASVARLYIPSTLVDTLNSSIHDSSSKLFQNPDSTINALMNEIDPDISLDALQSNDDSSDDGSGSTGDGGANGAYGSLDQASQVTMGNATSAKSKGQTAGIAVGTVAGALVVGSLLMFATRKYRQRVRLENDLYTESIGGSQYHDDSDTGSTRFSRDSLSSILPAPHSTQYAQYPQYGHGHGGPAISQPVMSENSLGWL